MADRFASLSYEAELPAADLLVIATPDDHIESTARRLAPNAAEVAGAIHLSGFKSIDALAAFIPLGNRDRIVPPSAKSARPPDRGGVR